MVGWRDSVKVGLDATAGLRFDQPNKKEPDEFRQAQGSGRHLNVWRQPIWTDQSQVRVRRESRSVPSLCSCSSLQSLRCECFHASTTLDVDEVIWFRWVTVRVTFHSSIIRGRWAKFSDMWHRMGFNFLFGERGHPKVTPKGYELPEAEPLRSCGCRGLLATLLEGALGTRC